MLLQLQIKNIYQKYEITESLPCSYYHKFNCFIVFGIILLKINIFYYLKLLTLINK